MTQAKQTQWPVCALPALMSQLLASGRQTVFGYCGDKITAARTGFICARLCLISLALDRVRADETREAGPAGAAALT